MDWMEWVKMATVRRWETRRERGGAGVAGISRASMTRYERGDCPHQYKVEEWARGLGLDVPQAVAAWRTCYEVGLIAEAKVLRPALYWQRGGAGRVSGMVVEQVPQGGVRISYVSAWAQDGGYAGQIGRGRMVKAPTLAGVLAALVPVSA